MRRSSELWISLIAITALVALFALVVPSTPPSSLLGRALGIAGMVLMLSTEILYTIRKRVRDRAWGQMSWWLRAHVVTGLVGPSLVLVHGANHWHGTGGWAAVATVVVVISGFVGRYLYTAIPRAPSGVELDDDEIEAALSSAELRASANDLPAAARRRLSAESKQLRGMRARLVPMRALLARWHMLHVPLTLALFTLVLIHVAIALYYGAGMR